MFNEIAKQDTQFTRLQLNIRVKETFEQNSIAYIHVEGEDDFVCVLEEGKGICIISTVGAILFDVPSQKSNKVDIEIIDVQKEKKNETEHFFRKQTHPTLVCV